MDKLREYNNDALRLVHSLGGLDNVRAMAELLKRGTLYNSADHGEPQLCLIVPSDDALLLGRLIDVARREDPSVVAEGGGT